MILPVRRADCKEGWRERARRGRTGNVERRMRNEELTARGGWGGNIRWSSAVADRSVASPTVSQPENACDGPKMQFASVSILQLRSGV